MFAKPLLGADPGPTRIRPTVALVVLFLTLTSVGAAAAPAASGPAPQDLTDLSLQELMDVEVYSVSKSARTLLDSAAAVHVISSEEIRRSGATTIPELLRTVPGLQVARIDGNKWAISARGFNDRFANKLLVLLDGRSVYTPLFSGVFWDLQDTLLEDIDRIEVVRGPGATLWGANAVNGVINIITKHAAETRGTFAQLSHGNVEGTIASVRHGAAIGSEAYWRVYAKARDRGVGEGLAGTDPHDSWEAVRAGFRVDYQPAEHTAWRFQGDLYGQRSGSTFDVATPEPPFRRSFEAESDAWGGNLLARYRRRLGEDSTLRVQAYYDRTDREDPTIFAEDRDTFDIEAQQELTLGERHRLVLGAGYRVNRDDVDSSFTINVDPAERSVGLFNLFAQDDITLVPDRLRLTLGAKLEHNDYTGWEFQPNVRALWRIDDVNTLWAAVSRAVRTPSRVERDGRVVVDLIPPATPGNPTPFPSALTIVTDGTFRSENLRAYELGYRVRPHPRLSLDLATFFNDYSDLTDTMPETPVPEEGLLVVPLRIVNGASAEAHGLELATNWQPGSWVRLRTGYSYLDVDYTEAFDPGTGQTSPRHQFFLWSSLEPTRNLELDLRLRQVSALPVQEVDGYVTADVRAGWKFDSGPELAVVGQNLLRKEQIEFRSDLEFLGLPTRVERSIYLQVQWRF